MTFTEEELEIIREALGLAVSDIHNQIATCPDVFEYSDELDELYIKQAQIKQLFDRVMK